MICKELNETIGSKKFGESIIFAVEYHTSSHSSDVVICEYLKMFVMSRSRVFQNSVRSSGNLTIVEIPWTT